MNTIKNCHVQIQQTKPTTERQPHHYPRTNFPHTHPVVQEKEKAVYRTPAVQATRSKYHNTNLINKKTKFSSIIHSSEHHVSYLSAFLNRHSIKTT